ncbi:K+-transporting ATPase ATPase C chain [Kribbella orskensis]|uniref:Potassium-transporting ATPase KdpC subunit n=1 Tax=Kribbella orskensis TaxID=2512216 RepID=A0ABY2BTF2_9ACTN|nr:MULTISPECIES: potassium-transporting ATPase subunit C [Kribbella]TCN29317.1 K+-transporting ATPase ATPase C chain [Kribbella sp. VKM Ac-2500]TCO28007.1 K+-transporting ATPase ATPase C chain [Kribbella orskensis]
MASRLPATFRQFGVATRALAVFTIGLGVIYPLAMTGAAQALFNDNANGSIVQVHGKDVASDLIGQAYTKQATKDGKPEVDADGAPVMVADPLWFQTRPSAVDYDAMGSAASQLGPNNADLLAAVQERRKAVADLEGVDPAQVPPDAVTASGSGLDPQISPAYAALQVDRVARERGLEVTMVKQLVKDNTQGRTFGFLGEPRVNVVTLNNDLAALK